MPSRSITVTQANSLDEVNTGKHVYRVVKAVNITEPKLYSVLTEREVNELIDRKITVNIQSPSK